MDAIRVAEADPCPKCGLAGARADAMCARCGVIFARLHADPARGGDPRQQDQPAGDGERGRGDAAATVPARRSPHRRLRPAGASAADGAPVVSRYEIAIVAGGFVAALVVHAVTPLAMILSLFVTLLHETGHAAAGWLFGCPSVPAFDFVYGGGITFRENFQPMLAVFIAAGWAWLAWFFRGNRRGVAIIAVLAIVWLVLVTSEWRRGIVISSMGHGGELILAGAFLWMALTGRGFRIPELERPLGAFVSFFVIVHSMEFASRLRSDESFLAWYLDGKGGALMNDLEVVTLDIKILTGAEIDVVGAAGWLMTASALVPVAVIVAFLMRRPLERLALRTFGVPVS